MFSWAVEVELEVLMVSEVEPFLLSQLQMAGCLVLMENLVFLNVFFSLLVLAFHCQEERLVLLQLQNETGHGEIISGKFRYA